MGAEIVFAKLDDLAIAWLMFQAKDGMRVDELGAEIQAAHDEGRDADTSRFRAQKDAARAAAHAHLDDKVDD